MADTVTGPADGAAPPPLVSFTPPEKPLSLLKTIEVARENGMATVPRGAYEQLVYDMSRSGMTALVVSDPEGVKRVLLDNVANYPKASQETPFLAAAFGDGLLTSDGEKWKSHRKLMAPSFDHRSIVSYAPVMVAETQRFLEDWDAKGEAAEIDIAEAMTNLTLKIISRVMFSADGGGLADLLSSTFERGIAAMDINLFDMLPVIGPISLNRKIKKIRKEFAALDDAMYRLMEERGRMTGEAPNDLLSRLLAARDADTGVKMTNQEVRDEMVIIFIAGHETTAVAMTFAFYLLSQRPEQEAKLHEELDRVLGGRTPTHDDLANLPYTRMVIEEALRLYPPAPGLSTRQAVADDVICGRPVKKGTMILIAPWIIHRHRALWDDPDVFDPERFSPGRNSERSRFAFIPFGGGPRICIGHALAMAEARLILATVAQRYRLRLTPGQDIRLKARITLRPSGAIRMTRTRRAAG